ncbi:MAG TPA: serine hydrolase [Pseudomonadota bacterium]|nr:serine hydrolase [Pseudomonadota bacterium]HNO69311.1 serine hydrolase [Pseudomonadota bacterium]
MRSLASWRRILNVAFAVAIALASGSAVAASKHHRKPTVAHAKPNRLVKKKPQRRVRQRAVPTYTRAGLPNIQAHAAVVLDLSTGNPIYQKNPDEVRPIASISKLMAMMVVLDHKLDLDGETTISQDDARRTTRGAKSRLMVGMKLANRDLLHAALMASDNRAVLALGRAVGLSPAQYAQEMTSKARSLGLHKTEFHDPTGLDYGNVSSPRETVTMLLAALKNPLIAKACKTRAYVAKVLGPKKRTIDYSNTDVLLASRHEVLGGKTGYNDRAGYCLVVAAKLADPAGKGREVAMAFLGEDGKMSRFADFGRAAQWLIEKRPTETAKANTGNKTAKLADSSRG